MKSRSGRAVLNTAMGFCVEIVAIACGLILPRLILASFGSAYNGITTSITEFISCISLLKAGIGGVTRVALYKPLAENDSKGISEVVTQTERFMRKVSLIFVVFILGFASIYPLFINQEFDWLFSFSLVIIISISTFVQYFFGLTYQLVLHSDQNYWICSLAEIATYILNTTISVILIKAGCTIHIVKLGSAAVFVLAPLFYYFYVRAKYKIKKVDSVRSDHIKQRWDAVGHAVAEFVNNNTDVMVITVFLNLYEVSVYAVYHLVMQGIKKLTNVFITGFSAAFGNMYAKNEHELMKENLGIYEVIVFFISTVLYSVTIVMILPFVMLYTHGINDVEYLRPAFAVFISLAGLFGCYRIPYQTIVTTVGHYKQTRNGAFVEAGINIVLSIALIFPFGLTGVAIGTLVAAIFRSFQYAFYMHKNIVIRSMGTFYVHLFLSLSTVAICYILSFYYLPSNYTVLSWIMYATLSSVISIILTALTNYFFFKQDCKNLIKKLRGIRHSLRSRSSNKSN